MLARAAGNPFSASELCSLRAEPRTDYCPSGCPSQQKYPQASRSHSYRVLLEPRASGLREQHERLGKHKQTDLRSVVWGGYSHSRVGILCKLMRIINSQWSKSNTLDRMKTLESIFYHPVNTSQNIKTISCGYFLILKILPRLYRSIVFVNSRLICVYLNFI